MKSYEFSKYLETIIPEFIEIKSQHKSVLKEGGKFAPSIEVKSIEISKNNPINIIFINFTIVDKGGYHNTFDKILVTYDQAYIRKLFSDFLIKNRNKKIDDIIS